MKLCTFLSAAIGAAASAKEVHYDLTIASAEVSLMERKARAMTINGGIPGPVLRFREGDLAVIRVHNHMHHPTSIHWHGMLVPPDMDGVPFVTFPPIEAGTTFTYRFPIRQSGTYWYHSHTHLQEQLGVYGAIVIEPKEGERHPARDHVVVLGDWSNRDPGMILRNLRRGSDFESIRKRTAQSVLGAFKTGTLADYFSREAMRMPAMDLSDVAYDAFLTNGKPEEHLPAEPGGTVRLRIINAAAGSYFHLNYAGGPFTIVSADGQRVEPVRMNEPLFIAIAETYDVLLKVPIHGACEFRATAHDGSGKTSLWIGSGERRAAPDVPKPFLYESMMGFDPKHALALTPAGTMGMPDPKVEAGAFDQPGMNMRGMDHGGMSGTNHGGMEMEGRIKHDMSGGGRDHSGHGGGTMDHASMSGMADAGGHAGMKHFAPKWYDFMLREDASRPAMQARDGISPHRPFSPYKKLRAAKSTALPKNAPRRDIRLTLDGEMGRYVWMLNNRPITPSEDILIHEGEVVRFIMINRTMMHHPMHLHGHFFRVVNGQGDRSPLKHTVNVEPMSTTVIEVLANEPGDWFFHCHILYHMMSGMAQVVRYEGFTPAPETEAVGGGVYDEHDPFLIYGHADLLSNMTQGHITASSLLNLFELDWEAGWDGVSDTEWEAELTYGRFINRYTTVFAGAYAEGVDWTREDERLIGGLSYLLPGNFLSRAWIGSDGEARIGVSRELMLTPRLSLFGELEYDTREDWSYQAGLSYILTGNLSATTLWDSDFGLGAGFTVSF